MIDIKLLQTLKDLQTCNQRPQQTASNEFPLLQTTFSLCFRDLEFRISDYDFAISEPRNPHVITSVTLRESDEHLTADIDNSSCHIGLAIFSFGILTANF